MFWILWSLSLLVAWGFVFGAYPRFRKPILLASLINLPSGFAEYFYTRDYWNPPTLFNLGSVYGLDIEGFAYCFAATGLTTFGYLKMSERRSKTIFVWNGSNLSLNVALTAYGIGLLFFLTAQLFKVNSVHAAVIGLVACVGYSISKNTGPDSRILTPAFFFLGHYFLLLLYTALAHDFSNYWKFENLWGLFLFHEIPLEEICFGLGSAIFYSYVPYFLFKKMVV